MYQMATCLRYCIALRNGFDDDAGIVTMNAAEFFAINILKIRCVIMLLLKGVATAMRGTYGGNEHKSGSVISRESITNVSSLPCNRDCH
jgi:hypothetical protein